MYRFISHILSGSRINKTLIHYLESRHFIIKLALLSHYYLFSSVFTILSCFLSNAERDFVSDPPGGACFRLYKHVLAPQDEEDQENSSNTTISLQWNIKLVTRTASRRNVKFPKFIFYLFFLIGIKNSAQG